MQFNILLFLLNLFPAFPLDGGRALLDIYLACGMTPRRAASLCVALSVPLTMTAGILFVIFWGDWLSFVVSRDGNCSFRTLWVAKCATSPDHNGLGLFVMASTAGGALNFCTVKSGRWQRIVALHLKLLRRLDVQQQAAGPIRSMYCILWKDIFWL